MEMIIVVPASFNRNSVGAAVTSEVCPTVPGPYQSIWGADQIKTCQVFPSQRLQVSVFPPLRVNLAFGSSLGFIS